MMFFIFFFWKVHDSPLSYENIITNVSSEYIMFYV